MILRLLFGGYRTKPKKHVNDEEERLRVAKLRADLRLAEHQLSSRQLRFEFLKAIAGVGGILAGIAALLSFAMSSGHWLEEARATREARSDDRITDALTLLASDTPSSHLAGVVALRPFLNEDSDHAVQASAALTHALALEQSALVRSVIVDTLLAARAQPDRLTQTLEMLIRVNRALVVEGGLHTQHEAPFTPKESSSAEARAASVTVAIAGYMRRGVRTLDMSRTYLMKADLSGLRLDKTSFASSILIDANFAGAHLNEAIFTDATLEGTDFAGAHLVGASFRQSVFGNSNYVHAQLYEFAEALAKQKAEFAGMNLRHEVRGPSFRCADLERANFTGHTLAAWSAIPNVEVSLKASFQHANLAGAVFSEIGAVGLVPHKYFRDGPFQSSYGVSSSQHGELWVNFSELAEDKVTLATQGHEYALTALAEAFDGAMSHQAKLPATLRGVFGWDENRVKPPPRPCR